MEVNYLKRLEGKCRSAIDKYQMINEGDLIAIGMSGGKDSLTLAFLLSSIKTYYPQKFDVIATTVDIKPFGKDSDFSNTTEFLHKLNIPHIIKRINLFDIIFKERKETNPCSLCSRMRNGVLHNIALENGCNKIALAHHLDDGIETFFMNMFSNGRIKCFSPISYLSRKNISLIRPLIFLTENEIKNLVASNKFPVVKNMCPVDGETNRQRTKEIIKQLDNYYGNVNKKILTAMMTGQIDGWG